VNLWQQLDAAVKAAGSAVSTDLNGVVDSALSGLQLQVKTNLGPAFLVGGLASKQTASDGSQSTQGSPGLFHLLGLQYSVQLLDANGKEVTHYGDPPATNPILATVYAVAALGSVYLIYRGVRSFF
jgi:hypothetical protein